MADSPTFPAGLVATIEQADAARPALVIGGGEDGEHTLERTYGELRDEISFHRQHLADVGCRGVVVQSARAEILIPWVLAARGEGLPVVLAETETSIEDLRLPPGLCTHAVRDLGLETIPGSDAATPGYADSEPIDFVLQTSGTTGVPKLATHSEANLLAAIVRRDSIRAKRWLLTYGATRFAGVQVWLHAMCNGGTLVASTAAGFAPRAALLRSHRPEMVSATPTFWLQLLRSTPHADLAAIPIERITLGGEACSQTLLNSLAAVWPDAQITHIYASTEAGVGITVRDRREGLPIEILRDGHQGREFAIEAGELIVRSGTAMRGYLGAPTAENDGRIATGDLVEIVDDRILFRGRRNQRIHVAGFKVDPVEIETAAMAVDGVLLARAFGRKSPILGEVVAVQFVPTDPSLAASTEQQIRERFREWPAHKQPRLIEAVATIETNDSGKILR